jgi:enolase
MPEIKKIEALEILDSRGNPTLSVTVTLDNGVSATAKVPSGASTGKREAMELRDGDKARYRGKGVLKACAFVDGEIQSSLLGMDPTAQTAIDEKLRALDGTPNKSRLGANAILGVSLASAQAAALQSEIPLYAHLAVGSEYVLPTPMLNVLNGGRHADNSVDLQEFMIAPVGAPSFRDGLRAAVETFHSLKSLLQLKGYSTAVGDEGGFAPEFESNEEPLLFILDAIQRAGYKPGEDIAIMLDPAASEFFEEGAYVFRKSDQSRRNSDELIALWQDWVRQYPEIWSLEDGLSEEDRAGWQRLTEDLGSDLQLVGDDNFVTNPTIFRQGIQDGIANAILIKLNQIGTVTETLECIALAKEHGYGAVISHRSGETDDTSIADLAVATGAGQIKTGSASRGERIAKYNRLLAIEKELGTKARYAGGSPYARWKGAHKAAETLHK